MNYPTKMEANGHIYKINTDFRIGLACIKAINDCEITDIERFYAIETLLLGKDVFPQDELILKEKIELYLKCGKNENVDKTEIDFDYIQDEEITKNSIRQCYNNLDIYKLEHLHWYEYNELISGLTPESVLNRIRDLRNIDVSEINDEKRKNKIIEMQKKVALKEYHMKTEQDKKIDEFWNKITGGE